MYHSSRERILHTIQDANDQNLQQVKYNYTIFNDMIENLCFSVYLDTESQLLMYSPNVSLAEANQKMYQYRSTLLNTYPSVYAISIYNSNQQKFYSTLPEKDSYFIELSDYIENTTDVPILQPILREIPYGEKGASLYVFSYFLYDYKSTDGTPKGYIVVDQNANWLLDNFSELRSSNAKIPSRMYLLDQSGTVCSPISSSDDEALLKELSLSQNSLSDSSDSLSRTLVTGGNKYLVTSLLLKEGGSSLIMIQDYQDVFIDFQTFQRTFLIVMIIWCVLFIIAVFAATRSLYNPIQKTLDYVSNLSGNSLPEHKGDEFHHLITVYKDSQEKLKKQTLSSSHLIRQYQMEKLLTDSSPSVLKNFVSSFPEHWLAKNTCPFRVLRVTPGSHTIKDSPLSDEDFQLSLFVIQNILSEMLSDKCHAEIFISSDSSVSGIVESTEAVDDPILKSILEEAGSYIQKHMDIYCHASYSRPETDPARLNVLYNEVLTIHSYHYIYGPAAVLYSESCKANLLNENEKIPENLEKKCLDELKCDHLEEALKALEQIFDLLSLMKQENITVCIMSFVNHINYTLKELYQAQDYIAEHYSDPNLSSQTIGDYMNLTAKYVMKKFQDSAGISINDYIYEIRMQQAAILLTESNLPINKVAEQVGILNENYFYRLFKKKYGCTPRKYSQQNRKI